MAFTLQRVFHVVLLMSVACADIYLHVPRGSNNRLNENTATRTNANRLFDSQNNNRGGYNVGDKTDQPSGANATNQYRMKYFQSSPWKTSPTGEGKSYLTIEWTNQHGCGGNDNTSPNKQNCVLLLQYMCEDEPDSPTVDSMRNGVTTNTQDFTKPTKTTLGSERKTKDVKTDRGLHEPWDWYNKCYIRERNKGLFVADQKLTADNGLGYSSAIYTRQNPTGNRYGYECPEERDYFPYWHPTPWADIAVFAENSSMCSYYTSKSFNVQPYTECVSTTYPNASRFNNEKACTDNGGTWLLMYNYLEKDTSKKSQSTCESSKQAGLTYKWAVPQDSTSYQPECLILLDAPDCQVAPWSRSNHLGNGRDGLPLNYTWTLPHFPSKKNKQCVFRFRYNVSTEDYDPYRTDSKKNDDFPVVSPIKQNPYVYVMSKQSPLHLAINTAQYGRVFQDRSHLFTIRPRPDGVTNQYIYNLNVRGKRGNIVQNFPSVEYDFTPNTLRLGTEDLVHIQWTGSNTHNNGNPAGDGQAGDAGEGKGGTDRSNFVEIGERNGNIPTPFEQTQLWNNVEVLWIYFMKKNIQPMDLAITMASAGYYRCASATTCNEPDNSNYLVSTKAAISNVLDNAPASYEGALIRIRQPGVYNYTCTRNNSFSNRSQKGTIVVT
ncbi:protein DD3-3-like [Physella acuta]|uniref:protein DD3-3-like n=1 Tax=Physella acuta TaxID=109671 RepID=UPI0027DD22F3|nr:protein DD3-3-like [Physella acuta]XP_059178665.1 protein DD3-3-like [Physella acuta]XP_059178673.1 protein DD3-3-like [Physella acuta]XP_059178680.1 protein DD3-3-like [Physella acuta]